MCLAGDHARVQALWEHAFSAGPWKVVHELVDGVSEEATDYARLADALPFPRHEVHFSAHE
jgi:hypothetical protein